MTSHERQGVPNHWQLGCLFNSLFGLSTKKPLNCSTLLSLCEEDHWLTADSLYNGTVMRKAFPCYDVIVCYLDGLMQERRNSSALAMELRLSCFNPSIWDTRANTHLIALCITLCVLGPGGWIFLDSRRREVGNIFSMASFSPAPPAEEAVRSLTFTDFQPEAIWDLRVAICGVRLV